MTEQVARIAFRQEGNRWVAYMAQSDTMWDAAFMGAISMNLIVNPDIKKAFMDTMRLAASALYKEAVGINVEYKDVVPAPEHERSGNA